MPLLPRLVAMVAKFFMHERNVNNSIYEFFCDIMFIYFLFISNHGRQHKMLTKAIHCIRMIANCAIIFLCVKEKKGNIFYIIFLFILVFYYSYFYINNQSKQRKMSQQLHIRC